MRLLVARLHLAAHQRVLLQSVTASERDCNMGMGMGMGVLALSIALSAHKGICMDVSCMV